MLGANGSELAVYFNGKKQYTNLYAKGLVGREDTETGREYYYLKDHLYQRHKFCIKQIRNSFNSTLGSTRAVVTENR